MHIKLKIVLLSASIFSTIAFANESVTNFDDLSIYRKFKIMMESETFSTTIETQDSDNSQQASLSALINYVGPKVEYYFRDDMAISASVGSIIYASSNVQGTKIELDYQYYFSNRPSMTVISTMNSIVELSSKFSPYASIGYSNSNIYFNNSSLNFIGINAAVGADYYWKSNLPINIEIGYKLLNNNTVRTMSGVSFSLGIGLLF